MNTGIADAFNLGWKLAATLAHDGPETLLDTYEQERHAVRTSSQKAQFSSLKYTTLVTPKAMQAVFRALAEPLLDLGGEGKMARAFSELGIHARESELSLNGFRDNGVRAGDRALDASVVAAHGATRVYELIYRGRWSLLAFTGCAGRADARAIADAVATLAQPRLATFVITTESRVDTDASVLYDLDEEVHRVYRVRKPALYLVRPDGHVAVRVRPARVAVLASYLQRWLPDPSQAFSRCDAAATDDNAKLSVGV